LHHRGKVLGVLALMLLLASGPALTASFDSYESVMYDAILFDDYNMIDLDLEKPIESSHAKINVNDAGISVVIRAHNLPPKEAVTLWMAVFNNPAACASELCNAADFAEKPDTEPALFYGEGKVTNTSGKALFFASVGVTDDVYANLGQGLTNLKDAQIILFIRGHGRAQSRNLEAQLAGGPNGGCDPEPPHAPCKDYQAVRFQLDR